MLSRVRLKLLITRQKRIVPVYKRQRQFITTHGSITHGIITKHRLCIWLWPIIEIPGPPTTGVDNMAAVAAIATIATK